MIAKLKTFVAFLLLLPCLLSACGKKQMSERKDGLAEAKTEIEEVEKPIVTGAERTEKYFPLLAGKRIALAVNQTSTIGDVHLVDSLLNFGIPIEKIFAPEHGFRGHADAGEKVKGGLDDATGIPIVSLYGKNKKPLPKDLDRLDLVIFDIQDVGARFYTYISAMTYLMEACAENGIPVLILDRPNPNGHYVDGPVLEKGFESYVGMHAGVPVVHGMTVGEYAKMVNGEKLLKNGVQCHLTVVPCEHYDHSKYYELNIGPSPNLPNMRSIYLYPSLCFFEGTKVSVGRGTSKQFQVVGLPNFPKGDYSFIPESKRGAKYPKYEGLECRGYDLSKIKTDELRVEKSLRLEWLLDLYKNCLRKNDFFLRNNFFDKLAGGETLRKQIMEGKTEKEIRKSWEPGLEEFKKVRVKYLIYD